MGFFWCWQKMQDKRAPDKSLAGVHVGAALISADPPAAASICCLLLFISPVNTLGHEPFLRMQIQRDRYGATQTPSAPAIHTVLKMLGKRFPVYFQPHLK